MRLKFNRLNSESAMTRAQFALIARYAKKKNPFLIKRIGKTHLDHGRADRFPVVKLAKVDSDMP